MLLRVSLRLALGVYGVMSLICVVCTLLLPIETKGRPMVVRIRDSFILAAVVVVVAAAAAVATTMPVRNLNRKIAHVLVSKNHIHKRQKK